MVSAKEVGFFGGMRGEDANGNLAVLNLLTNVWTSVLMKVSYSEVSYLIFCSLKLKLLSEMTMLFATWVMAVSCASVGTSTDPV